jgi:hypothetical protein
VLSSASYRSAAVANLRSRLTQIKLRHGHRLHDRLGRLRPCRAWKSTVTTITDRVPPADAVETAIARVLDAEQTARRTVAAAESAAAVTLEAARAAARAIALRTEARIRTVRSAFERRTAQEVAALDAVALPDAREHALDAEDAARLDAAVTALAARFTGG